ncbi:MAG: hypothetical protein F9B45_08895 [Phycisphaera sp. RhM]|nr:hypothetical protein [Phycisphaera sp. RhM]
MKGETPNATVYSIPRSRLKREHHRLDWIDEYESTTVDIGFCNWLAEHYNAPKPKTNDIVARDDDACICLHRWNVGFARTMTSGDSDVFDGMIGGDSATEPVACFETWMTQRQAWQMWEFFRSSILEDRIVVDCVMER